MSSGFIVAGIIADTLMTPTPPIHRPASLSNGGKQVLRFTFGYLGACAVAAVVTANPEFVFYVFVLIVLTVIVWIILRQIYLPTSILTALSLWGLAHMAGGLLSISEHWPRLGEKAVLYNLWVAPWLLKFDQLVHAVGFGLVTAICWYALEAAFNNRGVAIQPTLGLMSFCVTAGMGLGAPNEIREFLATLILPKTNVGDYTNTGWGLVANACGALIAAAFLQLRSYSIDGMTKRRHVPSRGSVRP